MYSYNNENINKDNKNELIDSSQCEQTTSNTNRLVDQQQQAATYSFPNEAYNPYFNYFQSFNYSQYNYSNQYSAFPSYNPYSGYSAQTITSSYPTIVNNQSSPVSQSTSPSQWQQTSLLTQQQQLTPPSLNTNLKSSYIYPTPPSDNTTLNSTACSESNTNTSIASNDDQEKSKENLKPKEKNGRLVRRRNRVQFTQMQIDAMEAVFDKSHYPEVHVIDRLSDKLGISIERLSIWFQNRRAKFKKSKRSVNVGSYDSGFDAKIQVNDNDDYLKQMRERFSECNNGEYMNKWA